MRKENIMGYEKEGKLLMIIALPIMISMFIQALYNIVDSYFVAKLGEDVLTAVSLAFPFQQVMIAIAVGTGVGINALLSRLLGQKNFEKANIVANNAILLAVISWLIMAVVGLFFNKAYFNWQIQDGFVVEQGITYLTICTTCSLGLFGGIILERLLQSTGKTKLSMISQLVGALTNIVLDPILIFGLWGVPKLGISGAAIATIIGQSFSLVLSLYFNLKYNTEIDFRMRYLKLDFKIVKEIYQVGIPAILNNAISSIMIFSMNNILMLFSTSATVVLGIYVKLQSFIFMPIFGLNNGLIPIIAYNYGAKNKSRINNTIRIALLVSLGFTVLGTFLLWFYGGQLAMLFVKDVNTINIAIDAFFKISLGIIPVGIVYIICALTQALGKAKYALIIQIARQLLGVLPLAYLLSLTNNLSLVWWAFPITDGLALLLGIVLYFRIKHSIINNIGDSYDIRT
ncbi:MAG: MATE family efflux transporter [Erysipelotrichaceae bacterium]